MGDFLKHRSTVPELMDDLKSSGPVIGQTLKELEVINRLLGGNNVTLNGLQKLINNNQPIEIIDIGCGGGDMLKLICKWARKNNFQVFITGVDANQNIIDYARKHTNDYPEIRYEVCNVLEDSLLEMSCDIVTATLFTHHFTNEELVLLFTRIRKIARIGMVINDLHRHWFAYHSIKILTKFFSKSPMVQNDASLSVERSFRKNEIIEILSMSKLDNYSIKWFWAFRWQIIASWQSSINL